MAVTCTFGGLNINDGTNYRLVYEPDFGEKLKTFDEQVSYAGGVTQTNVHEHHLVTMTVPLRVYGSSLANLWANVDALNTKLDLATNDLVYNDGTGSITYHCLASPRVKRPRTPEAMTLWRARIDLVLYRNPVPN